MSFDENDETRIGILEEQVATLIDNGYEQTGVLSDIDNLDGRIKKLVSKIRKIETDLEALKRYVGGIVRSKV